MDIRTYCTLNEKKTDKVVPAAAGSLAALTADGALADAGVTPAEIVRTNGYAAGLRAGCADDLVGGDLREGERFLFRPTAARIVSGSWTGTGAQDGVAELRAIYGGAVLLRQQCGTVPSGYATRSCRLTASAGVFTLTSTTDNVSQKKAELTVRRGHVVYASCSVRGDGTIASVLFGLQRDNGTMMVGSATPVGEDWNEIRVYGTAESDRDNTFVFRLPNGTPSGSWAQFCEVMLFDLTDAFGAGNEPCAEDFRRWYASAYVASSTYTAMLPFRADALRTVGANALDPVSGTARVVGGAGYAVGGEYTSASFTPFAGGAPEAVVPTDGVWTAPKNGVVTITGGAGACVRLNGSGSGNDPYVTDTVSLPVETFFPDGMRAVRRPGGEVRDEMTAFAAVRRVGAVKMSDLTWTFADSRFTAVLPVDAAAADGEAGAHGAVCILTNRYRNGDADAASLPNRTFTDVKDENGQTMLCVRDDGHATLAAFLASLTDDDVVWYELAEPVVTQFEYPLNLTFRAFADGTEEVVASVPGAPLVADVSYGYDVRAALRLLDPSASLCRLSDTVPASSSAAGTPGEIAADAAYLYLCTASGWKRAALTAW